MTDHSIERGFEVAVDIHLKAVAERDLDEFKQTLVADDRLRIILPNGRLLQGYDAVVAFHQSWFADPDWSMTLERQGGLVTADMGYAFFEVTYHDLNEEGQPYQLKYWLSLTFVRENEQWLLVHDQNTLLK